MKPKLLRAVCDLVYLPAGFTFINTGMELIFSVRYFSIPEYGKLLEDTFNFFCLFVLFFKEKPFAWVTTGLLAFCMYRDIKERLGEQISTIVL